MQCKSSFQLNWENSRLISAWVWVNVWCLNCLIKGICSWEWKTRSLRCWSGQLFQYTARDLSVSRPHGSGPRSPMSFDWLGQKLQAVSTSRCRPDQNNFVWNACSQILCHYHPIERVRERERVRETRETERERERDRQTDRQKERKKERKKEKKERKKEKKERKKEKISAKQTSVRCVVGSFCSVVKLDLSESCSAGHPTVTDPAHLTPPRRVSGKTPEMSAGWPSRSTTPRLFYKGNVTYDNPCVYPTLKVILESTDVGRKNTDSQAQKFFQVWMVGRKRSPFITSIMDVAISDQKDTWYSCNHSSKYSGNWHINSQPQKFLPQTFQQKFSFLNP